ncbi:MAG TPA: methyltransferase, partial [Crocinitomicaceae bacterium]|nr:methyltransferase [Crocinitomicaceae bacterium]
WSGKVIQDDKNDKDTVLIREFNDFVRNDQRVESVLLPIRDGLSLVRKK